MILTLLEIHLLLKLILCITTILVFNATAQANVQREPELTTTRWLHPRSTSKRNAQRTPVQTIAAVILAFLQPTTALPDIEPDSIPMHVKLTTTAALIAILATACYYYHRRYRT